MDLRITILICIVLIAAASAYPAEREADAREKGDVMERMEAEAREKRDMMETMKTEAREKRDMMGTMETEAREKRDVMETMKSAWNEVVRTLSDAGDAVVHVFKPTERSVIDKMADGVKNLTQ